MAFDKSVPSSLKLSEKSPVFQSEGIISPYFWISRIDTVSCERARLESNFYCNQLLKKLKKIASIKRRFSAGLIQPCCTYRSVLVSKHLIWGHWCVCCCFFIIWEMWRPFEMETRAMY